MKKYAAKMRPLRGKTVSSGKSCNVFMEITKAAEQNVRADILPPVEYVTPEDEPVPSLRLLARRNP